MLNRINKLLENKWFPISFRILTLAAFLGLVFIGFSSPTNDPFFLSQLSRTNLTTCFVWRFWWPMIVLSAIFFGRVWCMICPVEMVTTFFAKIGFKLKRPRWILSGWVITLFYMIVLIYGITILHMDLNPRYTSYYLLTIMGVSVISGLIFEKNTFCHYICPVGYMLGIFSKMAIWGWRVKEKSVCRTCTDKSCIHIRYTYRLNYKSCGVNLVPAEINDNSHCLLCAGCLKTCKTYKTDTNSMRPNPSMVRIGFANDLLHIQPFLFVQWFFLFLLSGSLIYEIAQFQLIYNINFSFIPKNISGFLGIEGSGKEIAGVVYLFFVLPAILWTLPYIFILIFRVQISLSNYLKNLSLIFLPVIAAFFVSLVIMEIATKFPYYKYLIHDVKGVETIKAILFKQIEVPQLPHWTYQIFIFILILAIVISTFISFKVIRELSLKFKIQDGKALLYFLPFIFVFLLFTEVLLYQSF